MLSLAIMAFLAGMFVAGVVLHTMERATHRRMWRRGWKACEDASKHTHRCFNVHHVRYQYALPGKET